jgi:hypothetical protein
MAARRDRIGWPGWEHTNSPPEPRPEAGAPFAGLRARIYTRMTTQVVLISLMILIVVLALLALRS